jgi:hypothetical protein
VLMTGFCKFTRDTVVPCMRARPRNLGTCDGGSVDCDSHRDVGPTKTIRGVYMTRLNHLQRLAALSAIREWSS